MFLNLLGTCNVSIELTDVKVEQIFLQLSTCNVSGLCKTFSSEEDVDVIQFSLLRIIQ